MALYNPLPTQNGWDSSSDSELSDSPSLEEFEETERSMQFPSTPKRSIVAKNLKPRKRARLSRGGYRESDTSPSPAVRKRKQPRPTKSSKPQKEDLESEQDKADDEPTPIPRFDPGASPSQREAFEKESLQGEHLAPIQRLPGESDADLANVRVVDQRFLDTVSSDNYTIWKKRFLTRWDAPFVTSVYQYGPAYKERHFVVTRIINLADGEDPRVEIHLRTFQEMVLETFNRVPAATAAPVVSLNLTAFTSPSEWMKSLLSAPFFNHGRVNYGKPEPLFDALQLTFSFLLLSTRYPLAQVATFSRSDYDITKVYNWNTPFQTLFKALPAPPPHPAFPNLSRLPSIGGVTVYEYSLNTNDLVHIRNFFHRHMIHDAVGNRHMGELAEDSFYRSNNKLTELGHLPRPWTAPLQDPTANINGILRGNWVGFYSTVRAWPEKKRDLVELQTDAVDYPEVDPLTLQFSASTANIQRGAMVWPGTFANIPCFKSTVPGSSVEVAQLRAGGLGSTFFLRGTAPFMKLDTQRHDAKTTQKELDKGHPFNALRLRGVIHPLPAEFDMPTTTNQQGQAANPVPPIAMKPPLPIPGFRRVVLVLYKPTVTELIKQLEFADETFGSMFGVNLTAQLDQETAMDIQETLLNGGDLPEWAVDHLRRYLANIVRKREEEGAEENDDKKGKWTKEELEALETALHRDGQLAWTDIEYAYAYEGIICPGGNVMMGRWWRVGMAGMGVSAGCEINGEGIGVWDREDDDMPEGGTASMKKLERGPFIFWPMA